MLKVALVSGLSGSPWPWRVVAWPLPAAAVPVERVLMSHPPTSVLRRCPSTAHRIVRVLLESEQLLGQGGGADLRLDSGRRFACVCFGRGRQLDGNQAIPGDPLGIAGEGGVEGGEVRGVREPGGDAAEVFVGDQRFD